MEFTFFDLNSYLTRLILSGHSVIFIISLFNIKHVNYEHSQISNAQWHNLVKKSKKYLTENCSSFKQSRNSSALVHMTVPLLKYFTNRLRWKYVCMIPESEWLRLESPLSNSTKFLWCYPRSFSGLCSLLFRIPNLNSGLMKLG